MNITWNLFFINKKNVFTEYAICGDIFLVVCHQITSTAVLSCKKKSNSVINVMNLIVQISYCNE